MATTIFSIMVVLLLLGFPMMIPLIVGAFVGFYSLFGGFGQLETMVQQMMAGVRPASGWWRSQWRRPPARGVAARFAA